MKNREYWIAKKDINRIKATVEARREHTRHYREEVKKRPEDYVSATEKNLRRDTIWAVLMIICMVSAGMGIILTVISVKNDIFIRTEVILKSVIVVVPFLAVCGIAAGALIHKKASRIVRLLNAIEAISHGDYSIRLDPRSAGPLQDAYLNFNTACDTAEEVQAELKELITLSNSANIAKSNFLSAVTYEIVTPVNAILGMDELILRESNDISVRTYAGEIRNAGADLLNMVYDILDATIDEQGETAVKPIDYSLSNLITDIVNVSFNKARAKGLAYRLNVDPKIPEMLYGDVRIMKRVIQNLVYSAIKYTEEGSIELDVGYEKSEADEVVLKVMVKDTGGGIEASEIEKVTEAFARIFDNAKCIFDGLDLQLYSTMVMLKTMGAKLDIQSKIMEGTTVSFEVKQKVIDWRMVGNIKDAIDPAKFVGNRNAESFKAPKARLLVVDDSSVNLMIATDFLAKTEVGIDTAESGEEAVELSKENKYDIVYVDHMMPGMDGIETMRHIKGDADSLNGSTPIIVLTANVVPGAREEYIKEGFTDFIGKPFSQVKLEQSVLDNLPKNKVSRVENTDEGLSVNETPDYDEVVAEINKVSGISVVSGFEAAGGLPLYKKVVEEFVVTGQSRGEVLDMYYEQEDVANYTIQVHALKSTARLIGANEMSKLAQELEAYGKENNLSEIKKKHQTLMDMYRLVLSELSPIFETNSDLPVIDEDSLKDALMAIREMVEAFDFDSADSVMEQLKTVSIPEKYIKYYTKLKSLMAEVARDDIIILLDEFMREMNS